MSKYNWAVSITACVLLALFFLKRHNAKENAIDLLSSGVKTIGTVTVVDYKNLTYKFSARDSIYNISIPRPFIDIEVGEKFSVQFDRRNPENAMMLFSAPIYDRQDCFVTKPVNIKILNSGDIEYTYFYKGLTYKRVQRINSAADSLVLYQDVYVNLKNPRIAYISFP